MSSTIDISHSPRSSMEVERGSITSTLGPKAKPINRGPDDLAYSMRRWLGQQPHEEPYCGSSLGGAHVSDHGALLTKLVVSTSILAMKLMSGVRSPALWNREEKLIEDWPGQYAVWRLARSVCRKGFSDIELQRVHRVLYNQFYIRTSINIEVKSARVANVDILGMEKCWQHCWEYRRMTRQWQSIEKTVNLFVG